MLKETIAALRMFPGKDSWVLTAKIAALCGTLLAAIGWLSGFAYWDPISSLPQIITTSILLFFLPSLAEEILFRGLLIKPSAKWTAILSVLLFIAWHPIQAYTFGPAWSGLFLTPSFLLATLILGVSLTYLRLVTKSLWPPIALHWFVVAAWKLAFGGPFL